MDDFQQKFLLQMVKVFSKGFRDRVKIFVLTGTTRERLKSAAKFLKYAQDFF